MKMADYKVTIGEPPIQISFTIKDESELEERLQTAMKLLETITSSIPKAKTPELRKPKLGMEHIYQFTPDGQLELYVVPEKGVHAIFLALYCLDPYPASVEQLIRSTGLTRSTVTGFLAQEPYNQYARKLAVSTFGLSFKGKRWVVSTILPSMGVKMLTSDTNSTDED